MSHDLAMAGDCEMVLDFENHGRCVGNVGDSSVMADVSRDEFEGYDSDGSGGFGIGQWCDGSVLLRVYVHRGQNNRD